MSGCCNEPNCRRSKPVMLMRSDLTGTWYVVTDYTDLGDGNFRANTKHRLPDNSQDQLENMRDGHAAAARADRLADAQGEDSYVMVHALRKALAPREADA